MSNPLPTEMTSRADQCVKCGLCLPHCPTFRLTGEEAESPRGRIGLIQGLARGDLEPDAALELHLNQCLSCRSCERVCPAQVEFGPLLDAARAQLVGRGRRPRLVERTLANWVEDPRRLRALRIALKFAHSTGLTTIAKRLPGRIGQLARMAPARLPVVPRADWYPAPAAGGQTVSLFRGCVSGTLDAGTLHDAIRVLNHLGVNVRLPATQGCCGALHAHSGRHAAAGRLARQNLDAFAAHLDEPIITCVSGCGATLCDYAEFDANDGADFASRIVDLGAWLLQHRDRLPDLSDTKMLLHEPCTLRNVQRSAARTRELLSGLGATLHDCAPGANCCGAAGAHVLMHPQRAAALADALLVGVDLDAVDVVVTSNVGCAWHLAATLAGRDKPLAVLHPVSLLAARL